MLSDNQQYSEGRVDSIFEPKGVVLGVIRFISLHLPLFIIDETLINPNKIEEGYNNQLSMYFNAKRTVEAFQFQHEYGRKNARKPDMGIPIIAEVLQGSYGSIFDVECKRLNTQLSHVRQYVCGNTGGIERFKRNQHGTDLPSSAIIGYIENETNTYWVNQINTWIKGLNKSNSSFWTDGECLFLNDDEYYTSTHHRIPMNNSIILYHFFYSVKL